MKPDGWYKCKSCKGRGWSFAFTDHEGNESGTTSDCLSCNGSGAVRYINGMTENEYRRRQNSSDETPLQYYDDECFPYSALINTPQGKIQIGDLSVGQTVWSFQNGVMVKRPITKKLVHGLAKIMKVAFGSGNSSFECTASHSFLTDKGYLSLSELSPGGCIVHMGPGGKTLRRITSIVDTGKVEPVFNLYTQGEHNFFVDGYVAHNFTRFRTLRTIFHRLFLDGRVRVDGSLVLQR